MSQEITLDDENIKSPTSDEYFKIISGTSVPGLAEKVCEHLGKKPSETLIRTFADGEIGVQILDNVRGCDVFIIESMSNPVNEHMMELFLLIDAAKRASAKRITTVIPYYGYARQDRKTKPRVPISAALVAQLLEAAGCDRVMALDLHCGQIQGFFRIPVDNLYAKPAFMRAFKDILPNDFKNICVVSPDAGGTERADEFRRGLNNNGFSGATMAMMNKTRKEVNEVAKMELVGNVKGYDVIIVDDMIDTAGTLTKCAEILKENGAKKVYACATHALLSGPAIERIEKSVIEKVIVTDSVPLDSKKRKCNKIVQISVAKLLGACIRKVHEEKSVSSLFK